jgi:hypothetical protein
MTSRTSGVLVYWNAHTGFGEIDLDREHGRIGIYRVDLLRAGVKRPQVGARFHFNTGFTVNGVMAAMDLYPEVGEPTRDVERTRVRPSIQAQTGPNSRNISTTNPR